METQTPWNLLGAVNVRLMVRNLLFIDRPESVKRLPCRAHTKGSLDPAPYVTYERCEAARISSLQNPTASCAKFVSLFGFIRAFQGRDKTREDTENEADGSGEVTSRCSWIREIT